MLDISSLHLAQTAFLQNNVPLRVRRSPYTNSIKLSRRKFFVTASSPKEHERGWQPVGMKKVLQVWTTVETQNKEIKEQWWELTFWFRLDMPLNPYRTLQMGRWLPLTEAPFACEKTQFLQDIQAWGQGSEVLLKATTLPSEKNSHQNNVTDSAEFRYSLRSQSNRNVTGRELPSLPLLSTREKCKPTGICCLQSCQSQTWQLGPLETVKGAKSRHSKCQDCRQHN